MTSREMGLYIVPNPYIAKPIYIIVPNPYIVPYMDAIYGKGRPAAGSIATANIFMGECAVFAIIGFWMQTQANI